MGVHHHSKMCVDKNLPEGREDADNFKGKLLCAKHPGYLRHYDIVKLFVYIIYGSLTLHHLEGAISENLIALIVRRQQKRREDQKQ